MKLKTYVAIGTFAFGVLRAWNKAKRTVRKNAKMGLKRASRAL